MEAHNKPSAPVNASERGGSLGTPIPGCLEAVGAVPGLTAREVWGSKAAGQQKGENPGLSCSPMQCLAESARGKKPRGCTRRISGPQRTPHHP